MTARPRVQYWQLLFSWKPVQIICSRTPVFSAQWYCTRHSIEGFWAQSSTNTVLFFLPLSFFALLISWSGSASLPVRPKLLIRIPSRVKNSLEKHKMVKPTARWNLTLRKQFNPGKGRLILSLIASFVSAISILTMADLFSKALLYLTEAETLSRQMEEDTNFWPKSVLFRAQALVLLKQHKTFKRDMKSAGLTPEQTTVYEFFRSNLEFLKVSIEVLWDDYSGIVFF